MAGPSVLFMGRDGDRHSAGVLSFIEGLTDDVTVAWAAGRGGRLEPAARAWRGDLIFCFRSHIIVPPAVIAAARIAAVNFHPGPPNYRGTGCVNFALYDGAHAFGCTAHLLAAEIDAGRILDVQRFPVTAADDVESLLGRTHTAMARQACDVIGRLVDGGAAAAAEMIAGCGEERWSGPVGRAKDLDALMDLTADMSAQEVARRRRATTFGDWRPVEARRKRGAGR